MVVGRCIAAILLAAATAIGTQAAPRTVSEQCTQGLGLLQGRSEVELAARCRAAFSPSLCREAARSLGAQPWAPERVQASCDLLAVDFVAASPEISARGLEAVVAGKSDLDKSAGGKEAAAAAPTPQGSAGGFLSSEAKASADGAAPWKDTSAPVAEREPTAEEASVDADAAAVVVEERVDATAPAGVAPATKPAPKAKGAGGGSGAGAAPAEVAAVVNKAAAAVATAAKPALADAGKTEKTPVDVTAVVDKADAAAAAAAKPAKAVAGKTAKTGEVTSADVTAVVDKAAVSAATAAKPAKAAAEKTVKAGAKAVAEVKSVVAAQGEKKGRPTTRALQDEESISKKSDEKAKEKATDDDKSESDDGEDEDAGEEEDESGEEESKEDSEEDEDEASTSSLDDAVRLFSSRMGGNSNRASEKVGKLPHVAFLLAGVAAFSAALFGARRSRGGSGGTLPRLPEDSSEAQLVE